VGREGRVERRHVLGGELNVDGANVLLQSPRALGPWDGDDVLALGMDPRQRELRRGDPEPIGQLGDLVGERDVLAQRVLLEARPGS
jgi:hypothetical protein